MNFYLLPSPWKFKSLKMQMLRQMTLMRHMTLMMNQILKEKSMLVISVTTKQQDKILLKYTLSQDIIV